MQAPQLPPNEHERLRSLYALGVLDTPAEARFERLTRLACAQFNVPIALISLVDESRIFFKSRRGLAVDGLAVDETPRARSFCGHAILDDAILQVVDARTDPCFTDHPWVVGPPYARFYAGAPLHGADGARLGCLCLLDTAPRTLSTEALALLRDLADCVELELQRPALPTPSAQPVATRPALGEGLYQAALEALHEGVICHGDDGAITTCNASACRILGLSREQLLGRQLCDTGWRCVREDLSPFPADQQPATVALRSGRAVSQVVMGIYKPNGVLTWVEVNARPLFAKGEAAPLLVVVSFVDISNRRRVEETLLGNEELLSFALDGSGHGVWDCDIPSGHINYSSRWKQMFGYAETDLGPDIDESTARLHPDDKAIVSERLQSHLMGLAPAYASEHRIRCKDGSYKWVLSRGQVVRRDESGAALRMVGTTTDISDIKELSDKLQQSHDLLMNLAREVPGLIYQFRLFPDGHSTLPFVSEAISDLYELTAEQVKADATVTFSYVHADDRDALLASIQKSARDLTPWQMEYRVLLPQGGLRWLQGRSRPQRVADGSVLWHGFISDVTAIKETEHAMQRLALVAMRTTSAVVISDAQGRMEWVNPAFGELTGYAAEDCLGQKPGDLLHGPQTDAQTVAWMHDCQARRVGFNVEILNYRKDGSTYWAQVKVDPVFANDGVLLRWIGVQDDITEKREAQASLQALNESLEAQVEARTQELEAAKNQAEAASRAKSAFLANMSHEIRTPLNSVLGMAHLAMQCEPTPKLRDYLEKISFSGYHLLGLINDILDFSKIEAGRLELEINNFDLGDALQGVLDLFAQKAREKQLHLRLDVDGKLPQRLRGDVVRISQILINLLGNAIKFAERGEVSLRAEGADFSPSRLLVRFEVSDQGIGMSEGEIARLFKSFEQADSSTSRKYGGTGLGLAICKQLVGLMGGEIGVRSAPGQGSTFWFTLMLAPASLVEPPVVVRSDRLADMRTALRGKHVLVVEDNLFNQQVCVEMLEALGMIAYVADQGVQALELLKRMNFDCVLMDLQMPIMDGYETTRQIRANPQFAKLPILAMTANASQQDREKCLAVGMDDFFTKPVLAGTLYQALSQWLNLPGSKACVDDRPAQTETAAMAVVAEPEAQEEPLFDLRVLAAMIGDDPALISKFVYKFEQSMHSGLQELDGHLASGDLHALALAGHRLKSVALTVGAKRLGAVLSRMAALKQGGVLEDAQTMVAEAHVLFALIAEELARQPR